MNNSELLGIDVGSKNIGVARINTIARIASPVTTIQMKDDVAGEISQLAEECGADTVVVGLPTTTSGVDSQQTEFSRQFAEKLKKSGLSVHLSDETLSTVEAKKRIIEGRYKKNEHGAEPSIDEISAVIILEDFVNNMSLRGSNV